MASRLINKYVWIVDTILRHRRITRQELNELWIAAKDISDGCEMPRRTFFNYCKAIESTFDIDILCDRSTYEYYIESDDNRGDIRDWLLDSFSISGTLSNSREIASRIVLENVPSARDFLPTIVDGMRRNRRISFQYRAFDRIGTTVINLDPYFIRIFRQRWYVIGLNHKSNDIRTYALDRISDVVILGDTFPQPPITAAEYFKDCFGIYHDKGTPKKIRIKVLAEQAKYFMALPLHPTQREEIHDQYSIFSYKMLATYDLVQALLSYGYRIEVLAPKSLRVMVAQELRRALEAYPDTQEE